MSASNDPMPIVLSIHIPKSLPSALEAVLVTMKRGCSLDSDMRLTRSAPFQACIVLQDEEGVEGVLSGAKAAAGKHSRCVGLHHMAALLCVHRAWHLQHLRSSCRSDIVG